MNDFVRLFTPLVYAFLLLALVLIVRKRTKNGAVPIPVGVSRKSTIIPKPITAAFRCWAKHPWRVSWGAFLFYVIVIGLLNLGLDDLALDLVNGHALRLLSIVLILSFILWVFLIWQRSGIRAVLMNVAAPLLFVGYLAAKIITQFSAYGRRENDSIV